MFFVGSSETSCHTLDPTPDDNIIHPPPATLRAEQTHWMHRPYDCVPQYHFATQPPVPVISATGYATTTTTTTTTTFATHSNRRMMMVASSSSTTTIVGKLLLPLLLLLILAVDMSRIPSCTFLRPGTVMVVVQAFRYVQHFCCYCCFGCYILFERMFWVMSCCCCGTTTTINNQSTQLNYIDHYFCLEIEEGHRCPPRCRLAECRHHNTTSHGGHRSRLHVYHHHCPIDHFVPPLVIVVVVWLVVWLVVIPVVMAYHHHHHHHRHYYYLYGCCSSNNTIHVS
jgi:hypothetical protein